MDEPEVHTPTPLGDRLMLAGAAMVMVAAVVMIIGGLLPDFDATGEAKPSATPTPTASPTPAQSPTRQLVVVPGPEPTTPAIAYNTRAWIRATQDLGIQVAPFSDSEVVATLPAGGVALVRAFADPITAPVPGWLYVDAPEPQGWVAVDGDAAVRFPAQRFEDPYSLERLIASGGGLLATGNTLTEDPYDTPWVSFSATGERWQVADERLLYTVAAWGPSGWLAISTGPWVGFDVAQQHSVWTSSTGSSWVRLGELGDAGWPVDLVASPAGYLMLMDTTRSVPWFSTDGLTWTESVPPGLSSRGDIQVAGTPRGFYAWDAREPLEEGTAQAAFSVDGLTWSAVGGGPAGPEVRVVSTAAGLVGMDNGPEHLAARVWTGAITGETLAWSAVDAHAVGPGRVSLLVSDGDRAVAFLWDGSSATVSAWETPDGLAWTPLDLPDDAFVLPPTVGAMGPIGLVVEDQITTLGRRHSAIRTLHEGKWSVLDLAAVAPASSAQPTTCPPSPRDALDLLQVDPGFAAYCYGDRSITLSAWIVSDGSIGWTAPEGVEPGWLGGLDPPVMIISPLNRDDWPSFEAVLAPGIEWEPAWRGLRVELTGHYDDEAASTCRFVGSPEDAAQAPPEAVSSLALVAECERRFVVTAVTPLEPQ